MATNGTTIGLCARARYAGFAALHYRNLMGFSVIPCAGKKPAVDWRLYQHMPPTGDQILRWSAANLFGNVGIICGAVSDNLVVIDLDGEAAVQAFRLTFPELLETYTVTSGSGRGQHIYLYATLLPPTTRVTGCIHGNIELRANGTYVVAPPSIHPDSGKPYSVYRDMEIARVNNLRTVVDWIKSLMRAKHGGALPTPAGVIRRGSPYAEAALRDQARKVQSARKGVNNQLNYAAFTMGKLIARGMIDRGTVETVLFAAAEANGYVVRDGERQTRATINSGIDGGIRKSNED